MQTQKLCDLKGSAVREPDVKDRASCRLRDLVFGHYDKAVLGGVAFNETIAGSPLKRALHVNGTWKDER
jgi:hypothetical protein